MFSVLFFLSVVHPNACFYGQMLTLIPLVHETIAFCGQDKTKAPQECGAYTKTQNIDTIAVIKVR